MNAIPLIDTKITLSGKRSMRDRAWRRHQNRRIEAKAYKVVRLWDIHSNDVNAFASNTARKLRDHLKVCSCVMCGNHRHMSSNSGLDRLTYQEKRAEIDAQQQLTCAN